MGSHPAFSNTIPPPPFRANAGPRMNDGAGPSKPRGEKGVRDDADRIAEPPGNIAEIAKYVSKFRNECERTNGAGLLLYKRTPHFETTIADLKVCLAIAKQQGQEREQLLGDLNDKQEQLKTQKQALDDAKACFNKQRLVLGNDLPNPGLQHYVDTLTTKQRSLEDEVTAIRAKLENFDVPQVRRAGLGVVEDTEAFEDAEDHLGEGGASSDEGGGDEERQDASAFPKRLRDPRPIDYNDDKPLPSTDDDDVVLNKQSCKRKEASTPISGSLVAKSSSSDNIAAAAELYNAALQRGFADDIDYDFKGTKASYPCIKRDAAYLAFTDKGPTLIGNQTMIMKLNPTRVQLKVFEDGSVMPIDATIADEIHVFSDKSPNILIFVPHNHFTGPGMFSAKLPEVTHRFTLPLNARHTGWGQFYVEYTRLNSLDFSWKDKFPKSKKQRVETAA